MEFKTKAKVEDSVYYLKKINREVCPICHGTGKIGVGVEVKYDDDFTKNLMESIDQKDPFDFEYVGKQIWDYLDKKELENIKKYKCPECNGKKTIKVTGQIQYEVGTGVIIGIEINMDAYSEKILYRITDTDGSNRTIAEDQIFLDQEVAEKKCKFMNLERRTISMDYIRIPKYFENTIPSNEKLMKRLDEWRLRKKFETEIYVDEKLTLFDGYTSFLAYRMLGITDVPVVIWPESERSK